MTEPALATNGPCIVCGAYDGDHDPGCMLRRDVWICSIFSEDFRLLLASRHDTAQQAVEMGKHHEKHGLYYRVELID